MNQSSIANAAFVQGFLKFGFGSAICYVLLVLAIDGTFNSVRWAIVIAFPIVGIAWGLSMWLLDRRKKG